MPMILVLWLIMSLGGMSKDISGHKPFTMDQTLALRGICAVEIMLGHIGLATGSMILYLNRKAGILFVGIFFLLSGYGVAYSADYKEGYLRHFLLVRASKMLLPAYFIKLIMSVIELFVLRCLGKPCIGVNLWDFIIGQNWYVWEQLFFYMLYWLAYKFVPKHIEITVSLISVAFIWIAFVNGMDNPWYGSTLCFALGLYYYKYESGKLGEGNIIEHIFHNRGGIYCVFLVALFLVLITSVAGFVFLGNSSVLGNPVARNVASVSFCMIVILLLYKFRIGNLISRCLGRCSYEIFLIHPYILVILKEISVESAWIVGIITVSITIIFSMTIYYLFHNCIWKISVCKEKGHKD